MLVVSGIGVAGYYKSPTLPLQTLPLARPETGALAATKSGAPRSKHGQSTQRGYAQLRIRPCRDTGGCDT